jgi:hypothetical protein
MIRFVRISVGFVASAAAVGWAQRALGLEDFGGIFGNAVFLAIGLLLASLSDREFFWNV